MHFPNAVPPEVDVTVPNFGVHQGDDVTLTCNVIKGNPMVYTYTWIHLDTSTVFTTGASLSLPSISFSQLGTYRCDVRNSIGVGRDSVTIEIGCEFMLFDIHNYHCPHHNAYDLCAY